TWLQSDVNNADFTHPTLSGRIKVADQLLAFFKTNPTTSSWFLRPKSGAPNSGLNAVISASVESGLPGVQVHFTATATDPGATITQYAWTFADGGFSLNQNPTNTFRVAGTYLVRLTISDSLGRYLTKEITIFVGDGKRPSALGDSAFAL